METLVGILTGLFVGIAVTCLFFYIWNKGKQRKTPVSGRFVIDFSDPMKDICRLELDEDLNSIYIKNRISLDIVTLGSQE